MKKLRLKKMNAGVYIAAFMVIAASILLTVMIGMIEVGFLHPRKTKLIIQTETLMKVYDGTPLVGEKYEIIYGRLSRGHSVRVLSQSSQTEIGESVNHIELMIRDTSGSDVTELYDIEQRSGKLTVTMRAVSVRLGSAKKTYDGTPLSNPTWELSGPNGFAEGHNLYMYSNPEITDVGKIANDASVKVLDEAGNDVTQQYSLIVEPGTLEIAPRAITITTESASKLYDGMPLAEDDWRLSAGTVASNHELRVHCVEQLTEVGTLDNNADVFVYDTAGVDVSSQYQITVRPGKLSVSPRSLYITTGSAKRSYDGTPLVNDTWTITSGALNSGETISLVGVTEVTEIGKTPNQLTFVIRDASGRDITDRYDIRFTYGTLTVDPRKITIMTGSAQKTYDGLPLTSDAWTLINGSLCTGHTLSIVGSSRTLKGMSENSLISYAIYQDVNGVKVDVTDCYQLTYSCGTLTVK